MQKKIILGLLISCVAMSPLKAEAQPSYFKSDADRVTMFNKITDFFATMGKSEREKELILRKRKLERKFERLRKRQNESR